MNQDIASIINFWNIRNPKKAIDLVNAKVKHADTRLHIYTIYYNDVKIKAIPFEGEWKIIKLL